jgi:hypothetical protein
VLIVLVILIIVYVFLKEKMMVGGAEHLTSIRPGPPTYQNTMTATRTGLGSIFRDPRFEPGPSCLAAGGSAIWAHGGHAGGPTFGSFTPYRFMPGNSYDQQYVRGFGDNVLGPKTPAGLPERHYPVEAW